jgi:NADPH-dependent 2,4-dienoyl-CoA reductase/sulfur reductase-like enzyme/rhodanese-related sulfurtransferase
MNVMEQLKIVVIGGVAAGPKAAARAKRCHPNAQVTIIEKGEWLSYGGCGLPYFLGATVKELKDLMATSWEAIRTPEFFKKAKDIDVLIGWEAVKIDRDNKRVEIKNVNTGETQELPYDKLVLATGAEPNTPPIEGVDAAGVFHLKNPRHALDMKEYLLNNDITNAIVIGGGLIGIETSEAIANWGIDVTIIEMQDQVLPFLLDKELASAFTAYLEQEDLNIITGTKVQKIIKNQKGQVKGVETDKGIIEGEMVLISAGVRPNIALAEQAGLNVEKGIIVNEFLQTSDPDIYAGGDCVVCEHKVSEQKVYVPLGSTANKHGRIIGTNVTGGNEQFPGVLGTSIVKVFDWNAGRTGLSEAEAKQLGYDVVTAFVPGPDKAHFFPGKKLILTKLIADRETGKILGAQLIGPGDIARRLDIMVTAITFGATAHQVANLDLAYAPPFSPAMDNIINAANVIKNIIDGKAKNMGYKEFKSKLDDDNVIYIDLRTEEERKAKSLPAKNILHIPYEELRARSTEIPRDKEIIVFCILSTRAFEAQLILNHLGFKNVKFVDAGIQFWPL